MRKVGDILKEEREHKELLLSDIEHAIKIKKEYLAAIERGDFRKLPAESYALGFVKNYAAFLGLPKGKIAALFRREYEEEKHEIIPEFRKKPYRFKSKSFLTAKGLFIVALFLMVCGYIVFQYNSFLFGPPLAITSPQNGVVVSGSVTQVTGKTDPYAIAMVDGEEVLVNLDGTFKKSLFVFPGDQKITIVVKNRFGKETTKTIQINVQ